MVRTLQEQIAATRALKKIKKKNKFLKTISLLPTIGCCCCSCKKKPFCILSLVITQELLSHDTTRHTDAAHRRRRAPDARRSVIGRVEDYSHWQTVLDVAVYYHQLSYPSNRSSKLFQGKQNVCLLLPPLPNCSIWCFPKVSQLLRVIFFLFFTTAFSYSWKGIEILYVYTLPPLTHWFLSFSFFFFTSSPAYV